MILRAGPFRWRDGERTVVFGPEALAAAPELLPDGYVLLTTPRAEAVAPDVAASAGAVRHVRAGRVDEIAAELLEDLPEAPMVAALGGGRVIDVAKAVGAVRGRRVAAVPTTLSGAEMTRVHRAAAGAPAGTRPVRPAVVLTVPALAASQPEEELAASALNALGHAAEGPLTPDANPVATLAAHQAAALLARGLPPEGAPDRDALALGALLAGYAIDSAGYGLHHVLSQTLAREAEAAHGAANAAMLGVSLGALRERFAAELAALDAALADEGGADGLAARLFARAGGKRLGDLGLRGDPAAWAAAAAKRPDLARTPPAPDAAEIEALYRAAW